MSVGFLQGLSEALTPHAQRLNSTIGLHATGINNKLHAIENAVNDLGRGDIGSNWQRFQVRRKFEANESFELGEVSISEIWLVQSIVVDGIQNTSPAFIIEADGVLMFSVPKEGVGFEGIGGNAAFMPGETISMTARAAGTINCTLTIIRRRMPVQPKIADMGRDTDTYANKSTHDNERDIIVSRTDIYAEQPAELLPTEGRTG